MGNIFGHLFRISTWGESHGGAVGVVIDGCPSQLDISLDEIQFELIEDGLVKVILLHPERI